MKSAMRSGVVIVEQVEREAGITMAAGTVATSVGPFPGEGLDEAFGLAIGLWTIGPGEAMSDSKFTTRIGEGVRAIGDAIIGEHGGDFDAMEGVEADHLLQGTDDAGDLFVGMDAGEAQPRVVVDRYVQRLDSGAFVTISAITGAADARPFESAELFDVKMDQFTRGIAFVADNWRRSWLERFEQIQSVTFEDAPDGGFGDRYKHDDLRVGAALTTQSQNVVFEVCAGSARLPSGNARMLEDAGNQAFFLDSGIPAPGGFLADTAAGCCLPQCQPLVDVFNHLRSTSWGELGISVHVVRAVEL
jgi:hypothetical protein